MDILMVDTPTLEKLIHSRNIHHRDIHSVQHIQDHVHSIHRTGMHQHQPWAQLHAFHNSCIQDQDHDHSIHHTGKHQHQPWAQHHAFHSSCILAHVHSIHHSQDHVRNIPHTSMA